MDICGQDQKLQTFPFIEPVSISVLASRFRMLLVAGAAAGYMPVDLYNLNTPYGSQEELKKCIEAMHEHNIQVKPRSYYLLS